MQLYLLIFPAVLGESTRKALQSLSFLRVDGSSAKGAAESRCVFCRIAVLPQYNQC